METLQLNPAAVALADQALAAGSEAETITMVISTAVSEYVAAPSWLVTLLVPKRNCLKLISRGARQPKVL